MKTTIQNLLSPQARPTLILLAATGVLSSACSSETSPPGVDYSSDDLSTSSPSTTQTTALPTSTASSSTQTQNSSSTAQSSSSSSSSSSAASSSSSTSSSSNSTVSNSSQADDSDTSNQSSSASSQGDDSSSESDESASSTESGDTSTSGGEDSGEDSTLSAGCGKDPTIASNMYNNGNPISITAGDRQRRYILSVPTDYDNTKPYNLIIAWHQLDGNDKQMYEQNYYWIKSIPEAGSSTIFVAPNGEKNGQPCTGNGNGESGCGWPDSGGSNVELADAVVAQIEENFCIDKTRIFANGWSYGGSMSYRTACSRPLGGDDATWGVRGVAVYNGAAQLSSGGCTPSKEVAFYASHGTDDNVLGYDGGVQMANTYAQLNGCNWMTPTRATGGNHVCTNVSGCMEGYPVEFCSFVGPHTPDPQEGGQRWQPQEVWNFFSAL